MRTCCTHRMKPRTRRVMLLTLAVLTGGALVVSAACAGHGHGWLTPERVKALLSWHVDDLLDDLDADDAQRAKVQALADKLLASGQALHAEGPAVHAAIVDAWGKDEPDVARLHAIADERVDALRGFAHQAVDASIELHAILTPEQRSALTERFREHLEDAAPRP